MHIQGPRGSRRGGWKRLIQVSLGNAYSTDAPMHGACALSCLWYLTATSCLAAGVCRETRGETHLISTEVQQELPYE